MLAPKPRSFLCSSDSSSGLGLRIKLALRAWQSLRAVGVLLLLLGFWEASEDFSRQSRLDRFTGFAVFDGTLLGKTLESEVPTETSGYSLTNLRRLQFTVAEGGLHFLWQFYQQIKLEACSGHHGRGFWTSAYFGHRVEADSSRFFQRRRRLLLAPSGISGEGGSRHLDRCNAYAEYSEGGPERAPCAALDSSGRRVGRDKSEGTSPSISSWVRTTFPRRGDRKCLGYTGSDNRSLWLGGSCGRLGITGRVSHSWTVGYGLCRSGRSVAHWHHRDIAFSGFNRSARSHGVGVGRKGSPETGYGSRRQSREMPSSRMGWDSMS